MRRPGPALCSGAELWVPGCMLPSRAMASELPPAGQVSLFPTGAPTHLHPFLLSSSNHVLFSSVREGQHQPRGLSASLWVGGCWGEASGLCSLIGVFSGVGSWGAVCWVLPSSAACLCFPFGAVPLSSSGCCRQAVFEGTGPLMGAFSRFGSRGGGRAGLFCGAVSTSQINWKLRCLLINLSPFLSLPPGNL